LNTPDIFSIVKAAIKIAPYINDTPIITSSYITQITNASIFFKCENFQKTGSFKIRGATNAIMSLHDNQLVNGVATHSSGNHASALAKAASIKKCKAYIVMPKNSSKIKCEAVKYYGGDIIYCEPTLKSREETLKQVIENTGAIEIHPYNNYNIIAGQATAALEFIKNINHLNLIITPVGGGGLLSGTAIAIKQLSPNTKVIGAEPITVNDAFLSFYSGELHPPTNVNTIADGLRTSLGDLTFNIIRNKVDDIITVSEEAIIEAMKLIWTRMKIIIEPSAAVCLAILLEKKIEYKNMKIGIILSGGNVDIYNLPWSK